MKNKKYPAILEFIPLLLFFILNKFYGIYIATASIMIASTINWVASYIYTKKHNIMIIMTTLFMLVFGGMTIFLHDPTFIKVKITIINLIFAFLVGLSFITKFNFIKLLFADKILLKAKGWTYINIIWGSFFLILAVFNEIVWRNFSTDTWVTYKVFGVTVLSVIMVFIQYPVMTKYIIEPKK